jgi:transporter family protein
MNWFIYAVLSAIAAAATAVLAKIGVKDVNSNLATAIRTLVVVGFAWGMVFLPGAWSS